MTQEDINEVMANSLKRYQLEHLVFDGGNIESAKRLIRLLQAENTQLKAQLTWRPVSEKPEKDDWVTLRRNVNGKTDDEQVWFYHLMDVKEWELLVKTLGATHWFPIPPAPEGE
jgi:hypothetical protein